MKYSLFDLLFPYERQLSYLMGFGIYHAHNVVVRFEHAFDYSFVVCYFSQNPQIAFSYRGW